MDPLSDRNYSREELNFRQAFEQIYKQKLKQIQQFYSQQNKSLKKTLEQAYKKVLSDELLITMIGDKTTSKFIQARVEECFQNIVFNERQIIIQNQSIQITELKFRLQEMSRNLEKITAQNILIQNNTHREKAAIQGKNSQIGEDLRKKAQELLKSNLKIKQLQKELTQKDQQFNKVWEENEQLKKTLEHIDSELKTTIDVNIEKYQNQNSQLTKLRQTVQKLEKKLKETQQSLKEMQLQSNKTISDYKAKIDQYKQKMTQLINSTQGKQSILANKSSVTLAPSQMQRRLAQTIKQNQRRFQQLKQQKQKQRNELQRKYESRQRQTQQYYEKLLQKKVSEVQNQASEFWETIKKEQAGLRQLIRNYEENYVSNEEHQRLMKEREELILKMKQKMEEYEAVIEDNTDKIEQLSKTIAHYESTLQDKVTQIHKLQTSLMDQISLSKKYESTITELKSLNKKTQQKVTSLTQQLQKQSTKLTTQQSTNLKSSQDINFCQKQLKEKQLKCKELCDLVDDQERKLKKLQNQLIIVNANYNDIQALFKENKRALAELEFKIKQLQHDSHLTTNQYTHKSKKYTEEIAAKSQEIHNLSIQYKSIQQDFLTLKGTHTQLQTTNKKLTLEIKYMKDTQSTIKEDYSTQVNDLKNRIHEKSAQIQSLKNQLQINHQKYSQKIRQHIDIKKSTQNRIRQFKKALIMIQKLTHSLVVDLRKELDTIETQLKNHRIIYQNQLTLHSKTFAIQSLEIIRNIDHSFNVKIQQESQKFDQQKKLLSEKYMMQKQQIQKTLSMIFEKQKQQFLQMIQQKEKQMNKLQGDNRALHYEIERKKQQILQQQKSIQSFETKLARESEQHMKKLREVSNDFENEKNQLIEEYQQKRDITNGQIQQLAKTIQKLRIQMQNTKSNYEEQKVQISSQLRSIQQQQQVVKQTVYRKDQEMKRLDDQLRRTVEQKNYLQHSLRQLSQNDQRKMMRIHELEFIENQLNQSFNLVKVKLQRTEQENSLLKQTLKQNEENINKEIKNRLKVETQLKDIKAAIDRNDKFRDLRALQQMTVETQELTNKVNQMKRMSQYLDRTPLRS